MDTYQTIQAPVKTQLIEQRSRFIAYAQPVETVDEALIAIDRLRSHYYDARHICWAYRIGTSGELTRSQDDGEPSGTAGRPILGQIISADLTNILVVVVRYFGGVKLGTSGLIEAYRQSAAEAIAQSERCTRIIERPLSVAFGYDLMGEVMRYIKDSGARLTAQEFTESCIVHLSLRADEAPVLYDRLARLYGVEVRWTDL